MEVFTKSAKATQKFGESFARKLKDPAFAHSTSLRATARQGIVLALTGDLGSGKTTFVQGLAKGLGIKERVISPTFVIVREYRRGLKNIDLRFKNFYHVDLYRLERDVEEELKGLGIEEIWGESGNVVAIEWAEKVGGILPENTIWIKFEHLEGDKRRITI